MASRIFSALGYSITLVHHIHRFGNNFSASFNSSFPYHQAWKYIFKSEKSLRTSIVS
jgi:molybdenum-dependent DNA-binding transcriptional regulator ModE